VKNGKRRTTVSLRPCHDSLPFFVAAAFAASVAVNCDSHVLRMQRSALSFNSA
jgi:hypothetical protein